MTETLREAPNRAEMAAGGLRAILPELALAALCVGAGAAYLGWRMLDAPVDYSFFVAGNLAFQGWTKSGDYAAFYCGVGAFFAAFAALAWAGAQALRRGLGQPYAGLLAVMAVPALLWLASRVTLTSAMEHLLYASAAGALGVGALTCIVLWRVRRCDEAALTEAVGGVAVMGLMGMAAGVGVMAVADRLVFEAPGLHAPQAMMALTTGGLVGAASAALSAVIGGRRAAVRQRLRWLLVAVQIPVPCILLLLLPLPWMVDGVEYTFARGHALEGFTAVMLAGAYADLVRVTLRSRKGGAGLFAALSPACVCAAVFFMKASGSIIPHLERSDYHTGEQLLPWWMLKEHGALPYVDFDPVRGLVSYCKMFFTDLFGDGSTGTFFLARNMQMLLLLLPVYAAVSRVAGRIPALVCIIFLPLDGLLRIHAVLTVGLCGLALLWWRLSPSWWLAAWVAIGTALVLFAPGQGGLLVLATFPLGGMALWGALRSERALLARVAVVGTAVAVGVLFLTPLGSIIFGAVRYGLENAQVNDVANSLPWSLTLAKPTVKTAPGLWDFLRFGFIFMAVVPVVLLVRDWGRPHWERLAVVAVPVSVLMVLFVVRSAGSIGSGMSRPGVATMWAMGALLPLVLFARRRGWPMARRLWGLALAAGVVGMVYGFWQFLPQARVQALFHMPRYSEPLFEGADIGIPSLQTFYIKKRPGREARHMNRLQKVRMLLDAVLRRGETYFDMTNHNAQYFYFRKRVPVNIPAVYNMPHPGQQRRAVARLSADPPPLVLAYADNQNHNGGTAALRAHLVYRYVMENYVPCEWYGLVFLLRPDVVDRAKAIPGGVTVARMVDETALSLWNRAFYQRDVERLPASWGQSEASLADQMRPVTACAVKPEPDVPVTGGWLRPKNGRDAVTIVPGGDDATGRGAGLLVLRLRYNVPGAVGRVEARWGDGPGYSVTFSGGSGTYIVPLDAAPSWLMSPQVLPVTLRFSGMKPKWAVRVDEAALMQRAQVPDPKR